ncbi:PAS domain S-box protein [Marinibaculum pumilum]|uniref:histidine kinase n=1 Tax=Marinibaculum pumilum TaxID=1766165 RepID=A0ABV7L917_9PROT
MPPQKTTGPQDSESRPGQSPARTAARKAIWRLAGRIGRLASGPRDGGGLDYRQLVEQAVDGMFVATAEGRIVEVNPAGSALLGMTRQQVLASGFADLVAMAELERVAPLLTDLARGQVHRAEWQFLRKDGSSFVGELAGRRLSEGQVHFILRDISERKEMEAALLEGERRFRTLADNISQFAWMADPQGWIFWYNRRWYDYTGTTLEDMEGWGWRKVHHPDHVDRVVARIQHSWDTGEPWEDTFPLRGADGRYRWFLSRALPIRDGGGRIVRWFGTNTDVTEQREREEQVRLLLREVNHRSKNLLAVVQAVARQTAAAGGTDFIHRFEQRIQGLSASQDLLVRQEWRGVLLEDLIRAQLAAFADLIGPRIRLSGPAVLLTATAAQALGMALHELATNAGKYGALSNQAGTVEVGWDLLPATEEAEDRSGADRSGADRSGADRRGAARDGTDGAGAGPRLSVRWQERGGPAVTPPSRRGFGSIVLDRIARQMLGADVALDFAADGFAWRMTCTDGRALAAHAGLQADAGGVMPAAAAPPGRRVLVVEDEALVAFELAGALEQAGFAVVGPVARVDQALALIETPGCDCAVLDINLGSEMADPVAARLTACGLPFVTVSGYAPSQQPAAFRGAPFLPKPVQLPALTAELERLLAGQPGRAGV